MELLYCPNEILEKISNYLDINSAKNLSMTCRRYRDIVWSSRIFLKKLKLKLIGNECCDKKFCKDDSSNFRYGLDTAELINVYDVSKEHRNVCVSFVKMQQNSLTTLRLFKIKIDDFTLRETLKCLPLLETIVLSEIELIHLIPVIHSVKLFKLKSLTINHCFWDIFRFFGRSQIESLHLNSYFDEGALKYLTNFLIKQNSLSELFLRGTSSIHFFRDNIISMIAFKLKTFHINLYLGQNSATVHSNIIEFLYYHRHTLIDIAILSPNCREITAFVLKNVKELKSLAVYASSIPKNRDFYHDIINDDPNLNLETLKIFGFITQPDIVKRILLRYPGITHFHINDWNNNNENVILKFASKKCPEIQELSVTEIPNDYNHFVALNKLNIESIRYIEALNKFMQINNSIKILNIGSIRIERINIYFISKLNQLQYINELVLATTIEAMDKLLELFFELGTPKELKTIEITILKDDEEIPRDNAKKYIHTCPILLNKKRK